MPHCRDRLVKPYLTVTPGGKETEIGAQDRRHHFRVMTRGSLLCIAEKRLANQIRRIIGRIVSQNRQHEYRHLTMPLDRTFLEATMAPEPVLELDHSSIDDKRWWLGCSRRQAERGKEADELSDTVEVADRPPPVPLASGALALVNGKLLNHVIGDVSQGNAGSVQPFREMAS